MTHRQFEICNFIKSWHAATGCSPTRQEIAKHFGFKSPNAVRQHLKLIEKKGVLKILPGKARGIQLVDSKQTEQSIENHIPLLGNIAAGIPILARENIERYLPVNPSLFSGRHLFALRVIGESMKDAGIMNGDVAVLNHQGDVNNGEIAAVLINEEATLKRFFRERGFFRLKAENTEFEDIIIPLCEVGLSLRIAGKLVGILRLSL